MLLFCFVFALNMKTWHNWTIWRGRLPSSRPPFTQPIQTRNGQLIPTHYRHLNVLLICPKCSESHAKINKHGHDDGAAPSTWYRRYKERKTTEKRCQSKLENVKGGEEGNNSNRIISIQPENEWLGRTTRTVTSKEISHRFPLANKSSIKL